MLRKKIMSFVIALSMVLSMAPSAVLAEGSVTAGEVSGFSDMPEDWSRGALARAVQNGLLTGSEGKIMPRENLTRAQMALVIVRAFGANIRGEIGRFTDVPADAWYAEGIAKAYQMGVVKGADGKMNPGDAITREEAFAILARALKLQPEASPSKAFSDAGQISGWAKGEVYAMINGGYIQGSDGKLNPKGLITRAEFAQVMDGIIKNYINSPGETAAVPEGNVMVNVPGVTLKSLTVNGDLIIGDGVGDGEVVLDNVKVTGRMVVRGGGENSIIIRGSSDVSSIIIARADGAVSVKVQGDANVEIIYIDDGSDDVSIEGTVGSVEIAAADISVSATGASIGSIQISGAGSSLIVGEGSTVNSVAILAANAAVSVAGTVTSVTTNAAGTAISGTGTVGRVEALSGAEGAKVETPSTEIVVGAGVTGVTGGGGTAVGAGRTATNNDSGTGTTPPPTPGGGGGGGGASAPVTPVISSITAGKDEITVTFSQNLTSISMPNSIIFASGAYKFDVFKNSDGTVLGGYMLMGHLPNSITLVGDWGDVSSGSHKFKLYTGNASAPAVIAQSNDFSFLPWSGKNTEVQAFIVDPEEIWITVEDLSITDPSALSLMTDAVSADITLFDSVGYRVNANFAHGPDVDPFLPEHEYRLTPASGTFSGKYYVRFSKNAYNPDIATAYANVAALTGLTEDLNADFVYLDEYEYTLEAENAESGVTLTAASEGATIKYTYFNNTEVVMASSAPIYIPLNVGKNTVTIKVEKGGSVTGVYTITINRAAPFAAGEGGSIGLFTEFVSDANKFPGLIAVSSDRQPYMFVGGTYSDTLFEFPAPLDIGASSYTMEYSADGSAWTDFIYGPGSEVLTTELGSQDNFALDLSTGGGFFRLRASGGPMDEYTSNEVKITSSDLSAIDTGFSGYSLDESRIRQRNHDTLGGKGP